jgi:hypothetical protein
MFDTPNGQKFLGLLSKLAHAAEDLVGPMSLTSKALVRAYPEPDQKPFRLWTERDELAMKLFLNAEEEWAEIVYNARDVDAEALNVVVDRCYKVADVFLSRKRAQ